MTGHPPPVVTWSKSFGQLPQGRVEGNNTVLTLRDVQKSDSADYVCTATNMLGKAVQKTLLVVVSLPQFTVKPPSKIVGYIGTNMTLNCSATGDPQPVISWKRQGSQLPVGRSQQIGGALVIRDVQKEDAGIYICIATSAGVFDAEAVANVGTQEAKGELSSVIEIFIISLSFRLLSERSNANWRLFPIREQKGPSLSEQKFSSFPLVVQRITLLVLFPYIPCVYWLLF